jgi:hypothetical protein
MKLDNGEGGGIFPPTMFCFGWCKLLYCGFESKDFEDLCNCRLILKKEIIKLCIDLITDEEIHDLEQILDQSHQRD